MSRRIAAALLILLLTAGLFPGAAVAADTGAHWADAALAYAVRTGMMDAGSVRGGDDATRAELADMVTRLLRLSARATLEAFADVPADHPYAEALSKAVALGLLNGSDGKIFPDAKLTREEAFVILSRAFALPYGTGAVLEPFSDGYTVSDWAQPATAGLVASGLIQGADEMLRPKDPISRQELAQILLNLTIRVCDGDGGTAIIPVGTAVPEQLSIDGDLYLCTESDLTVKDLTVTGRLVLRGKGTVTLQNCSGGVLIACDEIRVRQGELTLGALRVTGEPTADAPWIRASLEICSSASVRQDAEIEWTLGQTSLGTQRLELQEQADARLHETVDDSQPLPEGLLCVKVTLGQDSLSLSRYLSIDPQPLAPPPVSIETIRVQATLIESTGLFQDEWLGGYIGWLEEGTEAIYTNYVSGRSAQLELSDGRTGWVDCSTIRISTDNYVRQSDYTDEEKLAYVNQSGYSSQTDYLVWVSLKTQRVNVFTGSAGNWKLVQSFTVATGKNSTPTIAGVFQYYYRVDRWDFGDYYVRPVLGFNGGHAFHSRTYTPSGELLDATLGYPVSAGCIRMRDEDVAWLDQHLPMQSTVVVY